MLACLEHNEAMEYISEDIFKHIKKYLGMPERIRLTKVSHDSNLLEISFGNSYVGGKLILGLEKVNIGNKTYYQKTSGMYIITLEPLEGFETVFRSRGTFDSAKTLTREVERFIGSVHRALTSLTDFISNDIKESIQGV